MRRSRSLSATDQAVSLGPTELTCLRCGAPHGGDRRRSYCLVCRPLNRAATHRRYAQENPERVRAWSRRYSRSEKCRASARGWGERNIVKLKSYRQAYYEHNRERILARRKEQRAAQWPRPRRCRAILCRRSFLVGPKQGAKAYCDQCISAFYGASRLKTRAA